MEEEKRDEELQKEVSDIEQSIETPEPEIETKPEPRPELPKKLVEQPKKVAFEGPSRLSKIKSFWLECKRVLRVTKKPDKQEFATIVKVSAIGMGLMGIIGFLVHFAKELLF